MSGLPFSYQIRRSARAQRARIVVKGERVEVVAPLAVSEARLHAFVRDKRAWVEQTLNRIAKRLDNGAFAAPLQYNDGALVPFRGGRYPLRIADTALKRIKVEFADAFTVHLPTQQPDAKHPEQIKAALQRWLWRQAAQDAERLLRPHIPRFNLQPRSISIRNQKSRWGSCGIHNDLQLNWLLVLAPAEVFEYVLVHEICHIRHKNHSADFWKLVAAHLPDYQRQRDWLKAHGPGLMRVF